MRKSLILCLIPLIYSGQNITPQVNKTTPKKVVSEVVVKDIETDPNLFKNKLDSINKENEKLVKQVNKYVDIIEKNDGFIKNNQRKIEKKTNQSLVKNKEVEKSIEKVPDELIYIPVEICIKKKYFTGRLFSNDHCKEWQKVDSIEVKIENY